MVCEDRKLVWNGEIPVRLQLHNSEVTTVPPPPPSLFLASRNGYLPLLVPQVKPHFQSALPIGQDTGWFEYEGLPLKWHVPIGVLFDLLCFEPKRPWNLMVHFRSFPSELLPYEGEDAMKWSFINSLKEASYVRYGSTKHVMNLSQTDQTDLWRSVVQADLESYSRVCLRLAPPSGPNPTASRGPGDPEASTNKQQTVEETIGLKVPFRLYVRTVEVNDGAFAKGFPLKNWDDITYISRPVDVWREDGVMVTLWEALQKIAPQLFACVSELPGRDQTLPMPLLWESESARNTSKFDHSSYPYIKPIASYLLKQKAYFVNGIVRIQGIEPSPDLPIDWIARNLCGADHFVHTCIFIATNERK
ncbi:hypothetical protein GOP47_0017620 [Adiantum capillus-veneris]|uniref:Autophagy protein 5 n=1 Tax=Adiantum capillus-veneris TaxID=13818 RepID=A0A9D4UG65_ADICA|nr:hypothetical protein GOP47_0017620 [Adiantum capillus-veneris]